MRFVFIILGFLVVFSSISSVCLAEDVGAEESSPFIYDDHGKRNPFWELIGADGNIISYGDDIMVTDMQLEGIMLGAGGRNVAIINGQVVEKNDTIGGFDIFDILVDTVVLTKGQKRFELKIKKEE